MAFIAAVHLDVFSLAGLSIALRPPALFLALGHLVAPQFNREGLVNLRHLAGDDYGSLGGVLLDHFEAMLFRKLCDAIQIRRSAPYSAVKASGVM